MIRLFSVVLPKVGQKLDLLDGLIAVTLDRIDLKHPSLLMPPFNNSIEKCPELASLHRIFL
jgi:hypothetical protein